MVLTNEEVKELKKQLSDQIKHLPEMQREKAQKQIDEMSSEALETMLEQQQTRAAGGGGAGGGGAGGGKSQKGIFRMIVDGDIKSKKIEETKDAMAVLDIRPASKGHVIIIPRKAAGELKFMSGSVFVFAKKIAKRMASKLGAESAEIQTENKFGETIVNVIPVYKEPVSINSPRYEADEKELEEVWGKLKVVRRAKVEKPKFVKSEAKIEKQGNVLILKRRIP